MKFFQSINWFGVTAVLLLFAAAATYFLPIPGNLDLMVLLGHGAIVSAIFSMHWVLERLFVQREINAGKQNSKR